MSDEENRRESQADSADQESSSGISLTLAYSLLGVAIIAAICIALFIVLPFYHRR